MNNLHAMLTVRVCALLLLLCGEPHVLSLLWMYSSALLLFIIRRKHVSHVHCVIKYRDALSLQPCVVACNGRVEVEQWEFFLVFHSRILLF